MMNEIETRPILAKYILTGKIILKTGTRIGGTDLGISIGGIDNPIIRNPLTGEPYIPGSSLKGKMRSLLERIKKAPLQSFGSGRNAVRRHECTNRDCEICRLFGSSTKSQNGEERQNIPSRIIVRDAHLTEESKMRLENMETDVPYAEWKMENGLDRVTCHASPRSNERVPAGTEFSFEIIYTAENKDHVSKDLQNIVTLLELVEDEYIGSSGSRGYGKVQFQIEQFIIKPAEHYTELKEAKATELKEKTISELRQILSQVKG